MPLAAPALVSKTPSAEGDRMAVVVGDGEPARHAARFLTETSWRVERLSTVLEDAAEQLLRDASAVIVDATAAPEPVQATIEHLQRVCPEAATILLPAADTPRPQFPGLGSGRPRIVPVPIQRESLLTSLEAEIGYRGLLRENRILRHQLRAATRLEDWVGCSAEAAGIRSAIVTTAFSDGPVLVVGEPGSGRRLAAELIHRLGRQSSLPFLALQAASLATGLGLILARLRRGGREFAADAPGARPGSLYLSGAEHLRPRDQAALEDALRRPPPFRLIISATPDLRARVRTGVFSSALLNRMEASSIRIPPLRERREDIPALLLHFLQLASETSGEPPFGISGKAVEECGGYDWPGNTAELRMWVERAVATARVSRFSGPVLPENLCVPPDGGSAPTPGAGSRPLKEVIAGIEKRLIERALKRTGGNQKRAARFLQMNPTTLHEKMKRHGLLRRAGGSPGSQGAGGRRSEPG
ncbi:MAG: sigma-54-dependent Fis family transcriptional regulator [Acidobacteria bacterium]|nr:sigma-54-dependent Fis family transcriptional regulator [Acidobacteriota bacterium]MYA44811.1 sigma-54-dependent Fis family transcriptional regulator [Acidobacteriota bacterium]MYH21529.1 sigma-54-dependent Fis family transcriptional regulator [Acidobacteriota bacterium]MYI38209.1 sigma-54-dependent Fis family transcriptional regulator [Acidobacteriota bacterium]MYK80493.1 sigma-54-dependent Fis family transcriptional regulator [Acidobacteriota bacterium]